MFFKLITLIKEEFLLNLEEICTISLKVNRRSVSPWEQEMCISLKRLRERKTKQIMEWSENMVEKNRKEETKEKEKQEVKGRGVEKKIHKKEWHRSGKYCLKMKKKSRKKRREGKQNKNPCLQACCLVCYLCDHARGKKWMKKMTDERGQE